MARVVLTALAVVLVLWIIWAARVLADPPVTSPADPQPLTVHDSVAELKLAGMRQRLAVEHRRYLASRRRVRQLQHVLMHRASVREAITLACMTYGSCDTLWRRADCESHLNADARNSSGASGLFQFLPSTWARTPFAALSIWSPYANALAAGWMEANGHGGEWACR